jgi:hypothetical protein
MFSQPPILLDPRQGDVGRNRTAPVEDALRSVPREFDTRPVSMNLHHPAAIDGPEKSDASVARAIATAHGDIIAGRPINVKLGEGWKWRGATVRPIK